MASSLPRRPTAPTNPLIVIIGATGTGKSNLAVSIASSLSPPGEIINADAMQLYSGLPIITNKISMAEQKEIPHHLLGTIGLDEEPWTVTKYVRECDRTIKEIHARGKVPVVVGGTGYYVHGLLMSDTTLQGTNGEANDGDLGANDTVKADVGCAGSTVVGGKDRLSILNASTEEIYAKLREVDPLMAQRWHPKDRRKIQRSLEIWLTTGKRASEIYAEQERVNAARTQSVDGTGESNVETDTVQDQQMRYPSLIFWLESEDASLKERLNKRVDAMVSNGLITEAKHMAAFCQAVAEQSIVLDKTKGIWASIGYKELEPWLDLTQCEDGDESSPTAAAIKNSCIEAVKAGTRRYAKRQNRYIRIRLANALASANASDRLFLLDCTNIEKWSEMVEQPSHVIVNAFLHGEELPLPADLSKFAHATFKGMSEMGTSDTRVARHCEDCDKILMTTEEWSRHITSRSHKKVVQAVRKRSLRDPLSSSQRMSATYRECP